MVRAGQRAQRRDGPTFDAWSIGRAPLKPLALRDGAALICRQCVSTLKATQVKASRPAQPVLGGM